MIRTLVSWSRQIPPTANVVVTLFEPGSDPATNYIATQTITRCSTSRAFHKLHIQFYQCPGWPLASFVLISSIKASRHRPAAGWYYRRLHFAVFRSG